MHYSLTSSRLKLVRAWLGLLSVLVLVSLSTSSHTASSATPSVVPAGLEIEGRIVLEKNGQLSNIRKEFAIAMEKLNTTKLALPKQNNIDSIVEGLTGYVGALSTAIQLESVGMNQEERQVVASAHFDAGLLHLSAILPVFNPTVAKTSLFYTPDGYSNREVENWKQDWLVKLAMAVEEDSAAASNFDNLQHYVLYDIFPLNLNSALYHFNKAALLGHTSARSLFAILAKMGSRSLHPSSPLPESTYDKPNNSPSHYIDPNTKIAVDRALNTVPRNEEYSQSPSSSSKPQGTDGTPAKLNPRAVSVADWKVLEHVFQDLSAGGKSPSALLLEGYQHLYGVDTQSAHCSVAKRALREATTPLLELMKQRTPSPALEFDERALPPQKLMERYTSQSMGSFKAPSQYERMDLIDYYTYQAREPHHHQAKNTIGSIYLYGTYGFERSYDVALNYFAEADRIHPSGQLAYMHHLGLGTNGGANLEKAVSLYSRAAAYNDSFALTQLGLMYLRGSPEAKITPDTRKALTFLTRAADREEVDANFHLGVLYRNGMAPNIPADPARSLKHIIFAATHGHMGALLELAALTGKCEDSVHLYLRVLNFALLQPLALRAHEFYSRGLYDHAAVLYNIMASLGHETGQLNAAWLHERGLVSFHLTPQDLANLLPLNVPSLARGPQGAATLTATHFKQSLDALTSRLNELAQDGYSALSHSQNDEEAQYDSDEVDFLNHVNRGLGDKESASSENQRHAFELYRLAAQQGSSEAQLKQGDFYYYGIGVPVDYNRSVQFYLLATNSKHAQAAFNLGYMYQRGIGVPADYHLAKRYYDAAITSSHDAYLAASFGLATLQVQNFFFGSIDPTELSWDNSLLIVLSIALTITIILKWRIR
jgi:TPR repeat protein